MAVTITVLDGGLYEGNVANPYVMPYTGLSYYDYIVVAAPRYQSGAVTLAIGGTAVALTEFSSNTAAAGAELSLFVYDVATGSAPDSGDIVLTQDVGSANLGMNVYGIKNATGFTVVKSDAGNSESLPGVYPLPDGWAALQYVSARTDQTARGVGQGFLTSWTTSGPTPDRQVYAVFADANDPTGVIEWSGSDMNWAEVTVNFLPSVIAEAPYQGWPRGGNVYAPLEA